MRFRLSLFMKKATKDAFHVDEKKALRSSIVFDVI